MSLYFQLVLGKHYFLNVVQHYSNLDLHVCDCNTPNHPTSILILLATSKHITYYASKQQISGVIGGDVLVGDLHLTSQSIAWREHSVYQHIKWVSIDTKT